MDEIETLAYELVFKIKEKIEKDKLLSSSRRLRTRPSTDSMVNGARDRLKFRLIKGGKLGDDVED